MFAETITYPAALIAGILSFFSPCVLPLIPGYFTFITGYSLDDLATGARGEVRKKVFLATVAFVLGFSVVFILLGASASSLGSLFLKYRTGVRIVGGLVIIILGIHMTGWVRIRMLDFEKRVHFSRKPVHFLGTFLVGMAFGTGWSPCIGPLLGSILVLASVEETIWQGILLLGVYSSGLAIPFIFLSIFIDFLLAFIKKARAALQYINLATGVLLIVLGLLLVTDQIHIIAI